MDNLNLQALGLEKQWPKLAKLQREIQGLEKQLRESQQQVQQMRAALPHAEQKDLDNAAAAVRSGEELPHASNSDSARRQLEAAERTASIMERAVSTARQDLAEFMQKHQQQLFEDCARARNEIAQEIAKNAQAALASFGRWSDLHYVLKDLQPPPQPVDLDVPPQRLTQAYIGIHTTRSAGPDRGTVEGILSYLMGLAQPVETAAAGDSEVSAGDAEEVA